MKLRIIYTVKRNIRTGIRDLFLRYYTVCDKDIVKDSSTHIAARKNY